MGRSRPPTAVLAGLPSVGALTVSVPLPGAPLAARAPAMSGEPRITISLVVRDVPRIIHRIAQILGHDTAP